MKVVTAEEMKNIDRRASTEYGIPTLVLMENAALAVVDLIAERYPEAEQVTLFCGTGQNGGDGFAMARHLFNRGVTPHVVIVGEESRVSGDAKTNLDILRRLNIPLYAVSDSESLDAALVHAFESDLLVDAMFGTGLTRPLDGIYADVVDALENFRLPIVAVDVPSGIQASTGVVSEPVVRADVTVTFALPKIAHLFEPAASCCGEVVVADISIPAIAVAQEGIRLSLLTAEEISLLLPPRNPATHKGTYGHAALVCGSEGRSGAAILAARGAVRSGAGLVTVMTDGDTARLVDAVSIESMTEIIDLETAPETLASMLARRDAVLVGCGLADNDASYAWVRNILPAIDCPLVIDASALNALQGDIEFLASIKASKVITPHPGELARLTGASADDVNGDRLTAAREAARRAGSVVVLKGYQTLVASPDGEVFINPTGNPGMATGGMGDVLAGMLVALLAGGMSPLEAARAAVFLHGLAGDLAMSDLGDTGLRAMDVAERIPLAIERARRG